MPGYPARPINEVANAAAYFQRKFVMTVLSALIHTYVAWKRSRTKIIVAE
jgi:hypothetical protein